MSRRHVDVYPVTEYDEHGYENPDGYPQPEPVRRTAPPSVHLGALLGYLGGLALLLVGAYGLGGGRYVEQRLTVAVPGVTDVGLAAGALYAFGGLLTLAIARKLQRGRRWVRVLVLVLAAASMANTLYSGLVTGGQANVLLGLVLPVVYIVLLNTPAARSWFSRRTY